MPVDTIFLSLLPNQRGTGTTDRRMVNLFSESVKNPLTQENYYSTHKRPGLATFRTPATSAAGRGIYAWQKTGKIYSVSGTQLVSSTLNGSTTLASLAASSGRVWFTETPETASTQVMVVSDGTDSYVVNTSEVTVQIDENDDAEYPVNNQGPVVFYSNYLFYAKDGKVYNSNLNAFNSFTAGDTISIGDRGDALEAIELQRDQLIAFGKRSVERLFDNGNPSGSPLLQIAQNIVDSGLAAKETLAKAGDTIMFVGETNRGRSVWMMSPEGAKEVSDSVLNRFLNAESTLISSATCWMGDVGGQLLYVLNLSSADRTFVYNVNQGLWDGEWEDANGGNKFPVGHSTMLDGTTYVQDASTGIIYRLQTSTYQDAGTNLTITLQTEGRDQQTTNRKSVQWAELIADTQSSGTATLSSSDDDFTTFTNVGVFDLTQERKIIHRCGSYKGKRAWRLTYSGNTPFRAKMLRLGYTASVT